MLDRARNVGALERLHCLKTFPSFKELPAADLAVLAQYAAEKFFRRKRLIIKDGEAVRAVHLLVEGQVRVQHQGRPRRIAGPGEGIGFLELLAEWDNGIEAVAEAETLTLAFPSEVFMDILEDHFSILHHVIKDVCTLRIAQRRQLGVEAGGGVTSPSSQRKSFTPRARELDLAERIMFMRKALPFAKGSIAALAELSHHVTEVRFAAGDAVWREGEDAGSFLMVLNGSVAASIGDEPPAFRFGPEAVPGALEALAARPRWFDATAEDDVRALKLDAEHLLDVFEDNFEMATEYLAVLARQALVSMEKTTALPGAVS